MCEQVFGPVITLSTGKLIPTRWAGEQHVQEDFNFIPNLQKFFDAIRPEHKADFPPVDAWMAVMAADFGLEATLSEYATGVDGPIRRVTEWLGYLKIEPWMCRNTRQLSIELEQAEKNSELQTTE